MTPEQISAMQAEWKTQRDRWLSTEDGSTSAIAFAWFCAGWEAAVSDERTER